MCDENKSVRHKICYFTIFVLLYHLEKLKLMFLRFQEIGKSKTLKGSSLNVIQQRDMDTFP